MRIALWRDGRCYTGRDAGAVIDAMRADSVFTEGKSRDEYMAAVARRVLRYYEAQIDGRDPVAFLRGLESAGLIRQELMQ